MSGFKLLAISPLEGCDEKYRKNLISGQIYQFYQDYKFEISKDESGKEVIALEPFKDNVPSDLYSIKRYGKPSLDINISAIVGKNGSGKSSLIELFYLAVYSCYYKQILSHYLTKKWDPLVDISFDEIQEELTDRKSFFKGVEENKAIKKKEELKDFIKYCVKLMLYYKLGSDIFSICINTEKQDDNEWYKLKVFDWEKRIWRTESTLPIPFYSIALNYSIHGLNHQDMGEWIQSVFHKNDGYQTPIVINPKREYAGNIDVDNERGLQSSRMLVNILDTKSNNDTSLFNGKKIHEIHFTVELNYSTPDKQYQHLDIDIMKSRYGNINTQDVSEFQINTVISVFSIKPYEDLTWIERIAVAYVTRKIRRIEDHYPYLFKFEQSYKERLEFLKDYKSHITFKLHQAIHFILDEEHFLKKKFLAEHQPKDDGSNMGPYLNIENETYTIKLLEEDINQKLFSNSGNDKIEKIYFLPPPFLYFDILFSSNENNTFNNLSSGEKQQLYVIHTVLYHIRNISSVKESENQSKYANINLLFDEVELYFHPDLQKSFIQRLLDGIDSISKYLNDNIMGLNIIFATHSPFILSDIPSSNVLRLKEGRPEPFYIGERDTFGANIHDLLANDFFLEDGFMGEFAKEKINETIRFINNKKRLDQLNKTLIPESEEEYGKIEDKKSEKAKKINKKIEDYKSEREELSSIEYEKLKEDFYSIIKLIGEPALRGKIREMFYNAFPEIEQEESYEIELSLLKQKYNKK